MDVAHPPHADDAHSNGSDHRSLPGIHDMNRRKTFSVMRETLLLY
jgi:hypothetical protein